MRRSPRRSVATAPSGSGYSVALDDLREPDVPFSTHSCSTVRNLARSRRSPRRTSREYVRPLCASLHA